MKLNTTVSYVTGLYILRRESLTTCDRTKEGLVAGVRLINCNIQSKCIIEETRCQTCFPRVRTLWTEVLMGTYKLRCYKYLKLGYTDNAMVR